MILGDLNSDLLARGYEARRLSRILGSLDLHNVIKDPTRVTETTATIIDLLITSDTTKLTSSGTFDPGFSDHCLVYGTLNLHKEKTPPRYVTVKNYKHVNITNLKHNMASAPWSVVEIFDDIDDMTWAWETLYKNILNEHLTERKAKIRSKSLPWMNSHIRKTMNKRFIAL